MGEMLAVLDANGLSDDEREAVCEYLLSIGANPNTVFSIYVQDGFVETHEYRLGEDGPYVGKDGETLAWQIVQWLRTDDGTWIRLGEQWIN